MLARLTGLFYLCIMVLAMFAEAFVRDKLIVSGDAAATLRNIAASEGLWRWGVAADLATTLCDIAVAALLFVLLVPVNRPGAITAAFFRLAYSAAMAANAVLLMSPLLLLKAAAGGSVAHAEQVQFLVMTTLRLHAAGFQIALGLFGVHLTLLGLLIARSTFLPRLIGGALAVAGVCYLANTFIGLLAPALASRLFPWILLPGFLAEASLTLWLLIVGLNPTRWREANPAH
jgi:hypothetical protein